MTDPVEKLPDPVEKFIPLGRDNGFLFCMDSVDVSGFDFVAPMTLSQIMRLYYNLHKINATVSSGSGANVINELALNRSPIQRVCRSFSASEEETGISTGTSTYVTISWSPRIVRLLDGGGETLGYGFQSDINGPYSIYSISCEASDFHSYCVVTIGSYGNQPTDDPLRRKDMAETTLSGFPVVCLAAADVVSSKFTASVDATNLSASANSNAIHVDSLEFYTLQ